MNGNFGSIPAGRAFNNPDLVKQVLGEIKAGLKAVNYATNELEFKKTDLGLIAPYISTTEGVNGMPQVYENQLQKFQDYNTNTTPREQNSTRDVTYMYYNSYEIINGTFTPDWIKKVRTSGQDPYKEIQKYTTGILRTYENVFKPNIVWEALLDVPTTGGDYYAKDGAMRDTVIDASRLLTPDTSATIGTINSTNRNHYRGIAGAALSSDDLKFVKQYLGKYVGVNPNRIVGTGNMVSLHELEDVFEDTQTKDDFKIGRIQFDANIIYGMPFAITTMLPDYCLMFYVADESKPFVNEHTNPLSEYKGLQFESMTNGAKFGGDMSDLHGKFVIHDIGYQLKGRHYVFFLDITPNRYSGNTTRTADASFFTELTTHKNMLEGQWKDQGILVSK